jgi:hypothetical protein
VPTSSTNRPRRRRLRLAPPPSVPGDRAAVARALLGPVQSPVDNIVFTQLGDDATVPPMNSAEELLTEAISDAIAYRRRSCPRCPDGDVCSACRPGWDQAARYEWLWNELGLISERPHRPDLRDVSR